MDMAKSEAPRHVLIIVRNNVDRDARVLKEAHSLWEAGYRVTVMGLRTSARDKPLELREYCTIRRVTTAALPEDPSSSAGPSDSLHKRSPYAGPVGDLRHWAGRMRENRIYLSAALPLKPDVVISCDLTALPAGYWLKQRLGCRLVYDAHELFTEMSGPTGPIYRFLYTRTESYLIRRADAVMTVNAPIAEEFSRRYRVPTPMVVMNGSQQCFAPEPVHQPLRLLFQGAYFRDRGLMSLLAQMHRVRGKATLTLQGFGEMESDLRLDLVGEPHGVQARLSGDQRLSAGADCIDEVAQFAREGLSAAVEVGYLDHVRLTVHAVLLELHRRLALDADVLADRVREKEALALRDRDAAHLVLRDAGGLQRGDASVRELEHGARDVERVGEHLRANRLDS
jgi:hypothetical protein